MAPSFREQIRERGADLAQREARGAFRKLCFMWAKYGNSFQAREYCDAERVSSRVRNLIEKTAVTPGSLSDWSAIADYQFVSTAFLQGLATLSVFDAALNDGMIRAPLRSRGFSLVAGITGTALNELAVKPISSLTLTAQQLELRKVGPIVIASKELLGVAGSQQLFDDMLTEAVVSAIDTYFLSTLIAATTPTASGGATLSAITADFETLLTAVTTSAESHLFYVTSPTNMKSIMAKSNAGGQPAYPNLGINGGQLWPNVTAIASNAISATAALMFDAHALVGNSEGLIPDQSTHATLQMETAPDSPPTASTSLLSLWQTDNVALRLERWFGLTLLRSSGVASLSGVSY